MKTRSHKTLQKNIHLQTIKDHQREEKQLLELGKPTKKQKRQTQHSFQGNSNEYDLIPFIPTVQLTIADMKASPLILIEKLQKQYSHFGAVKLACPPQWSPPMEFKHPKYSLTTRIQPLHQLKLGKEKKQTYSLGSFQNLANDFQRRYKIKFNEQGLTKLSQLQNQYWKLVQSIGKETQEQSPKRYKVTVQYAADLPVNKYGSGFPLISSSRSKDTHFDYAENLYNLNNIYRSPPSLLTISQQRGEYIGGVTTPWMYVGMMFSSFCWHVEDSSINSINYNHYGQRKVWYVIAEKDKQKFDDWIEARYGSKDVVTKITYMIDPLELIKAGIKVYKIYQQPKEYVCTFYRAYHCGFSQGFNIGEAVNFVIPESLTYIKESIRLSQRPPLFCFEWLIYQNYLQAMKKGKCSGLFKQEYQQMLKNEEKSLIKIKDKINAKKVMFVCGKTKYTRHVCIKCKKYLYLSFTSCTHCHKDYCLIHTEKCCDKSNFILNVRQPNQDRQTYLKTLKLL